MKSAIIIAVLCVAVTTALHRPKQTAFQLPPGAEFIVGQITTSFLCDGLPSGYYADVDNDCKIFHICHAQTLPDGDLSVGHWSFFCGNQTIFNQKTFTCAFPEEASPCRYAPYLYFLNNNIGVEKAPFLTDEDIARAYVDISKQ